MKTVLKALLASTVLAYSATQVLAVEWNVSLWGKRRAPDDMRRVYYDVGPVFFWELTKALWGELWRGLRAGGRAFRDAHTTGGRA